MRDELRARGAKVSGNKDELIQRLEELDRTRNVQSGFVSTASQMKVHELREQLEDIGLSPTGTKTELVSRLNAALSSDPTTTNPFVASPRRPRSPSIASPRRGRSATPRALQARPVPPVAQANSASLTWSTPHLVIYHFDRFCFAQIPRHYMSYFLVSASAVFALFLAIKFAPVPSGKFVLVNQVVVFALKMFRWFALGLSSSIAIGRCRHSFLLHLAPFVMRVTTAARLCNSTDFPKYEERSAYVASHFPCDTVTLFGLLRKVFNDVLAWSLGFAIGNLVLFYFARIVTQRIGKPSNPIVRSIVDLLSSAPKPIVFLILFVSIHLRSSFFLGP